MTDRAGAPSTEIAGSATVRLGHSELTVRPIGLGCMGMSQSYGPADDAESIATVRGALDLGLNFLDTSDIYGAADVTRGVPIRGFGHNEQLLGEALAGRHDEVVLATKFAAKLDPEQTRTLVDGRPEYVASACDASLRRLGVDVIDLYYCHRVDPKVPVEDTVGAMGELVAAGKVRAIGMSEVSPELLRRAHAVHPISALQSEYSLWERGVEAAILPTCRELGVTFVPYSPLGRAALTGALSGTASWGAEDFRSANPRFSSDNLSRNLEPVQALQALAEAKGCRPGQLALAWLLAQGTDIVPIPGTKRIAYVEENLAATNVPVSADEVSYLRQVFSPDRIVGERYAPVHAAHITDK
jgi:aryl-alcohol dehydrogenase-like predicted oxidoreductase